MNGIILLLKHTATELWCTFIVKLIMCDIHICGTLRYIVIILSKKKKDISDHNLPFRSLNPFIFWKMVN